MVVQSIDSRPVLDHREDRFGIAFGRRLVKTVMIDVRSRRSKRNDGIDLIFVSNSTPKRSSAVLGVGSHQRGRGR